MAGASLNFDIFGRDQGVTEMFDKVGDKAKGLSGIFGAAGAGVAGLAAPLAAAFAVDKIGEFSKKSVDAFSELEDSTAAASVVFGDSMSKIIDQSKTADRTLGMSSQQVINAANTFGTYGKAAGLGGDDLAGFSTKLTGLAGDMASFKGTSTEQAIEAVGAALRGETEPIRAYGVMLDDASLKDEAMRQGLIKTTKDALTPQQKILAAQALIFKQTTDAQGDYARTSTSTANVAKTLASAQENLSAKVGTLLAPAFTMARRGALEMTYGMSSAVDWLIPKFNAMYTGIDKALSGVHKVVGGVKDLFKAGFTMPKLELGQIGSDLNPIIALGAGVRFVFDAATGPVRAFFAAFKAGDGEVTSSGLAGVFEKLGGSARDNFEEIRSGILGFGAAWRGQIADVPAEGFAGKMEMLGGRARDGFAEAIGGVMAFHAAFKAGDGQITSAGFAGKLEGMGVKAREAFDIARLHWIEFTSGFKFGTETEIGGSLSKFQLWGDSLYTVFANVKEAASVLWDGIKTGSNDAHGGIDGLASTIGNGLHNGFAAGLEAAGTFWQGLKSGEAGSGSGIAGVAQQIGAGINGIFTAVGPLLPSLLQLWQQLSPISLIFQALLPVLPQLAGLLGQLAVSVGGQLAAAVQQLMPVLQGVLVSLVGTFAQLLPTVLGAIAQIMPIVVQAFMSLVPVILQVVAAVVPFVVSLLPPLLQLFAQLVPIVMQVIQALLPLAVGILGVLLPALMGLVQLLAAVLIPVIEGLLPVVSVVFGAVAQIIGGILQVVVGIIQVFTGILAGNWSAVWSGILNIFSGIWQTIVAVVSGVIGVLGAVISGGLHFALSIVGSVLGGIGSFFSSTWSNIIGGVGGFIGNLLGFFAALPGQIGGFLAGAGSWLYNAGRNIIDGLINGVKSMMGAIGNAILSLVPGPIVGVFKDALGIHSPSRVFHALGKHIPEGLIGGISEMVPAIEDRIGSMVPTSLSAVTGSGYGSGSGSINTASPGLHIGQIVVNESEQGGWRQMGNNILQAVQVQAPGVLA